MCLIVVGGYIAFFPIFQAQKHFIMTLPFYQNVKLGPTLTFCYQPPAPPPSPQIKVVDTQILTKISKNWFLFLILIPLVSKFNLDFEFRNYFSLFCLLFDRNLFFRRHSGILFEKQSNFLLILLSVASLLMHLKSFPSFTTAVFFLITIKRERTKW